MTLDCSESLAGMVVVVTAIFGIKALSCQDGVVTFKMDGGMLLTEADIE